MTIETDLYSTLTGDATVSGLISTRCYPNHAPESASLPYITYAVISGSNIDTVAGVSDMSRKLIQMDCNASTYAGAKELAAAVISALEGDGYLRGQNDLYDPETQVYTAFVDWSFMAV